MLATLTEKVFDRDNWIYEIKWDGYRAVAYVSKGRAELYSRNLKNLTAKFIPIINSLNKVPSDIILDGEIIITDSSGRPDFSGLKDYLKTGKGSPVYYVFDLLYIDEYNLMDVALYQRKIILEQLLPSLPNIKLSSHIEKTGKIFFKEAARNGLEGIMAKKASSIYEPSTRSRNWLKIKVRHTQDIVIGGYIKDADNKYFRSLLAGVYENNRLIHIGNVGSGFNQDESKNLFNRLNKITISKSPFKNSIKNAGDVVWVKPEIVAEAEFSQWTSDGLMRHPVFKDIRTDKKPLEVVREEIIVSAENDREDSSGVAYRGKLSNPDKVFWPDEGYTKGDLFNYYHRVSEFILPHLTGRPQSLHRHPDGITGENFFQKDINFKPPEWIETFLVPNKEKGKDIHYLVCRDRDSLLYMVNLGCIEINPWLSRMGKIECPDTMVIDLDPKDTGFIQVIKTALKVKEVLDMLGIEGFVKTSGATGIHIYVPTGSVYDYNQILQFANVLAIVIKRKIPGISSIERSPGKRQGKVYIDYLQNRYGQTVAAPYSVRPRPDAPVSTPLLWDELEELADPSVFNIKSIFERLEKHGDIWKDIYKKNLNMERALSIMLELYGDYIK